MNHFSKHWLVVALVVVAGCTKGKEIPKGPDGKPMVSMEANPERVVCDMELALAKEYQGKLKPTDLMIWDLKTQDGEMVAAQIAPVPTFPAKLVIMARDLFQPIPDGAGLLFSARIVKFGDEDKPPMKGQLVALAGVQPDDGKVVENKAVNQANLDKFLKKQKIAPLEQISVGAKVHAEFVPSLL